MTIYRNVLKVMLILSRSPTDPLNSVCIGLKKVMNPAISMPAIRLMIQVFNNIVYFQVRRNREIPPYLLIGLISCILEYQHYQTFQVFQMYDRNRFSPGLV